MKPIARLIRFVKSAFKSVCTVVKGDIDKEPQLYSTEWHLTHDYLNTPERKRKRDALWMEQRRHFRRRLVNGIAYFPTGSDNRWDATRQFESHYDLFADLYPKGSNVWYAPPQFKWRTRNRDGDEKLLSGDINRYKVEARSPIRHLRAVAQLLISTIHAIFEGFDDFVNNTWTWLENPLDGSPFEIVSDFTDTLWGCYGLTGDLIETLVKSIKVVDPDMEIGVIIAKVFKVPLEFFSLIGGKTTSLKLISKWWTDVD